MKKIILGLLVGVQFAGAGNEKIKMPEKDVLQKQFAAIGMTSFAEKTDIIAQLAGQKKTPVAVAVTVESSICDYLECLKKDGMSTTSLIEQAVEMDRYKPLIFEALLKNQPLDLEKLEKVGAYTPSK